MTDPDFFEHSFGHELHHLDSSQLETMRFRLLGDRDPRLQPVVEQIVARGVTAIEHAIERRARTLSLGKEQRVAAAQDAASRLMTTLQREDHLPAVEILAERYAAACLDAQKPRASRPRLAPRVPDLQQVNDQLGKWLRRRRRGRNDGRNGGTGD